MEILRRNYLIGDIFPDISIQRCGVDTSAALPVSGFLNPPSAKAPRIATRWSSALGSDPQWIYVNLGAVYSVNRVVLNWETAYGKSYQIQVSNDASAWIDAYATTGDGVIQARATPSCSSTTLPIQAA